MTLFIMILFSVGINYKYFPVVLGSISKEEYLKRKISHFDAINWTNKNLSEHSKVLVCGISGWFYFEIDILPIRNKSFDTSRINNPLEMINALKKLGITHIFIEPDNLGNISLKDFKIDRFKGNRPTNLIECMVWLNKNNDNSSMHPVTFYETKPYILFQCLELLGQLELLEIVETKIVLSRTLNNFEESQVAIYRLKY